MHTNIINFTPKMNKMNEKVEKHFNKKQQSARKDMIKKLNN